MNRFHSLALTAVVYASAIMSAAAPAAADQGIERTVPKPFALRYHAWHSGRQTIAHHYAGTRVAAIPAPAACTGTLCGRTFVLMLGVGF